jgi:hypothetical protein
LEELKRLDRQDYLLEKQTDSILKANAQNIETGKSTVMTNESIIKANKAMIGIQRMQVFVILLTALVSTFTFIDAHRALKKTDRIDLLEQRQTSMQRKIDSLSFQLDQQKRPW